MTLSEHPFFGQWLSKVTAATQYQWQMQGVAMVSAETPSENSKRTPNLLTCCRVSDKIATCVIEGLSNGENFS